MSENIKAYACKIPGYRITVPESIQKITGRPTIKWRAQSPKKTPEGHTYIEVKTPEVQKFIESHKSFGIGIIYKVKTQDEIEREKAEKERQKAIEKYKELYKNRLLIFTDETPEDIVLKIAKEIGAPTVNAKNGQKLAKATIVKKIVEILKN